MSYQENIDTSSPLGGAIFTIISAVAQLERDILAERVQAGLRKAWVNGERPGAGRKWKLMLKRFTDSGHRD